MKKFRNKGFVIALASILIVGSSFISCGTNAEESKNKTNTESNSNNSENNSNEEVSTQNKKNSTEEVTTKENTNLETSNKEEKVSTGEIENDENKNRFEGLKTTIEDMNIPVLCYHDVTPNNPDNNELLLSPEKFREQLQYLKDNDYAPLTLNEFYNYLKKSEPVPEKSVLITFDDGYKGNYEYAYPILKEFNFPATFFIISNFIGSPDFMTAEEIKEMSDNGIDIESHTAKHEDLSTLDEASQLETFKNSKEVLEEIIKEPIEFIAYPFGRHNPSTRIAAEKAGYKLGFNLNGEFADRSDNNYNIDRIYVSNNYSIQKFEDRLKGK